MLPHTIKENYKNVVIKIFFFKLLGMENLSLTLWIKL